MFVSWYMRTGRRHVRGDGTKTDECLRGCIGTFAPQPITRGLYQYTYQSAFEDHRFPPISAREVPMLRCAVSFLTDFVDCADYLDWELGTHGVFIHMNNPALPPGSSSARTANGGVPRKVLNATFLPEVPTAQGWTKIDTIDHAIRKAGWNGAITNDLRSRLRVQRYTSQKQSVTFDQYDAWHSKQRSAK